MSPPSASERAFLTAEWRYLAMLNFEIAPAVLRPLVPRGTELDTFAGRALVSVVGFRFLDTRVRGVPVPLHRNFDEVNLRFYVRRAVVFAASWCRAERSRGSPAPATTNPTVRYRCATGSPWSPRTPGRGAR